MLSRTGVEDSGTVLRPHIRALTVEGGGVMDGEEDVQQVGKGDDGRVESDFDDLGVAGETGAYLLVGGVGFVPAGVAGDDIGNAVDLVEDGFEAPEASAGQDDLLELRVCVHASIVSELDKNGINYWVRKWVRWINLNLAKKNQES